MLRAARFTSQLGFVVADDTVRAMGELAPRLEIVSVERISDELSKLLRTDDPVPGIRLLVDTGIAQLVIPEIPALRLEVDEHAHHKDVYEHSLTVLRQAIELEKSRGHSVDLVLRLAALLHDIGKPATRRIEPGGVVTFHHHDVVGAKLAAKRLKALRFDNDTVASVARLIELHPLGTRAGERAGHDAKPREDRDRVLGVDRYDRGRAAVLREAAPSMGANRLVQRLTFPQISENAAIVGAKVIAKVD